MVAQSEQLRLITMHTLTGRSRFSSYIVTSRQPLRATARNISRTAARADATAGIHRRSGALDQTAAPVRSRWLDIYLAGLAPR
ncbi:MAG TPA: hypothetical protein VG502_13155 [Flexivirga sp.]|uniref:hypothetical protein n=1 Tax=Flexivirga sp. TaxID=1962927 RepID=UPI002D1B52C6|nr:hypothetical protein [Flexivirga sp.]HWC23240.1 hypothetical protein [Flexivirga sp.]